MPKQAPLGVMILGLLTILLSAISAVAAVLALFMSVFFLPSMPVALLALVVSVVGVFVGFGLLGLRKWAWNLAVAYFVLQFVVGILGGGGPGCIGLILLIYLLIVRDHFR